MVGYVLQLQNWDFIGRKLAAAVVAITAPTAVGLTASFVSDGQIPALASEALPVWPLPFPPCLGLPRSLAVLYPLLCVQLCHPGHQTCGRVVPLNRAVRHDSLLVFNIHAAPFFRGALIELVVLGPLGHLFFGDVVVFIVEIARERRHLVQLEKTVPARWARLGLPVRRFFPALRHRCFQGLHRGVEFVSGWCRQLRRWWFLVGLRGPLAHSPDGTHWRRNLGREGNEVFQS
mmetsp:Transcript_7644/g.18483  ORF Transcript_7644/g.18483 Transcript_7644/m.18483 type:complete len:232 (-) Transcript_7644:558-1253(-)